MNSAWAQNVSTVAVAGLAWALAYIALQASRSQRLGREALLVAAAYLACTALVRCLSINAVISSETARVLVGITAFAALAILAQLAYLKRLDLRLRTNDKEQPPC